MHNIVETSTQPASASSKRSVSLVVISVGMIGIAALYGQGLGASRTALYRTQAVNLACRHGRSNPRQPPRRRELRRRRGGQQL